MHNVECGWGQVRSCRGRCSVSVCWSSVSVPSKGQGWRDGGRKDIKGCSRVLGTFTHNDTGRNLSYLCVRPFFQTRRHLAPRLVSSLSTLDATIIIKQ